MRANLSVQILFVLLLLCNVALLSTGVSLRKVQRHETGDNNTQVVDRASVNLQHGRAVLQKAQNAAFKGGFYAATAGIIQVLSLMWLRTTVNYQYRYGVPLITALRQLYKQGGIARFYAGLPYAIVLGPVAKFGATAANEWAKVMFASFASLPVSAEMCTTLLGTLLTVIWRVFLMPLETCKTVLQVDGSRGFEKLIARIYKGNVGALYQGSTATILMTAASHYPWFYTYNLLDRIVAKSEKVIDVMIRSAFIGFVASAASDTVSNCLRILKTVKQSASADGVRSLTYLQIVKNVYQEGGITALFGRGLTTRIITNGIQSILFTVLWKVLPMIWAKSPDTVNL